MSPSVIKVFSVRFSRYDARLFIFSQPDKLRMSQVTIRRPFGELDLCNQLWFEPHTVFHLFLGQSPLGALFLRQISKRANVDLHGLDKANLGRRVGIEVL